MPWCSLASAACVEHHEGTAAEQQVLARQHSCNGVRSSGTLHGHKPFRQPGGGQGSYHGKTCQQGKAAGALHGTILTRSGAALPGHGLPTRHC